MAQVTVIGGGVIGLSTAWQLAQAGQQVQLIHGEPLGTGTSAHAAGALKPFDALQTGRKQILQQESLWQYPAFVEKLKTATGVDVGYRRCGRLAIYEQPAGWRKAQIASVAAQENWPWQPAQAQLDLAAAQQLCPALAPTDPVCGVIHCHSTATFRPAAMLTALIQACQQAGVRFEQRQLESLPKERPLVLATGAKTNALVPQANVRPIKRQGILLAWPAEQPLQQIIENGQVYLVPWRQGQAVYIGSTFEPDVTDPAPTPAAEEWLRAHAARLVPALATAPLLERFSGIQSRGQGPSSLLLGELTSLPGVFISVGHGGVGYCMAPRCGQILTELVTTGRSSARLPVTSA